jgi:hypothetical protein
MFIERDPYLLSVSTPMDLIMCTHLLNRSSALSVALMGHISGYQSKGFVIKEIRTDGEKTIETLRPKLNSMGIALDTTGKSEHVPVVERSITLVFHS